MVYFGPDIPKFLFCGMYLILATAHNLICQILFFSHWTNLMWETLCVGTFMPYCIGNRTLETQSLNLLTRL